MKLPGDVAGTLIDAGGAGATMGQLLAPTVQALDPAPLFARTR
jgi:hypothetical protein